MSNSEGTGQSQGQAMPNAGNANLPRGEKARALAALQGMARPQPKPAVPSGEATPEPGPGSGASGFVGMLAKGHLGSGDSHAPLVMTPLDEFGPRPKSKYPLPMAREIAATVPPVDEAGGEPSLGGALRAEAARQAGQPSPKPAGINPTIYPFVFMFSAALAIIGVWAAGAVIYMAAVSPIAPEDVHYPLIRWSLDVGNFGGYTVLSRVMAWSMLLCLPLSAGFVLIGLRLRRRKEKPRP